MTTSEQIAANRAAADRYAVRVMRATAESKFARAKSPTRTLGTPKSAKQIEAEAAEDALQAQ